MTFQTLKKYAAPYYRNLGGWRTRRKILVIESDDWGSIRMPSRQVYERCLKAGYPVDRTWYERYDSLLSEDDLELLFGVLSSFRDAEGRHPVITANVIVGNPDFAAIEKSDFQNYHYEPITETFQRYPKHHRCWSLWQEGQRHGVLMPQFHGREHLNVAMFMSALRDGNPDMKFAFDNRMPGCIPKGPQRGPNLYVETTRFRSKAEKAAVLDATLEGLDLFENLFGFRSRTFIPTNYVWSSDFNAAVRHAGVEAYQGMRLMKEQQSAGTSHPVRRRLGDRNDFGQFYLVRNANFEPSQSAEPRLRAVDRCLHDIQAAFQMGKPAIISCHRLNFCGFIDEANRDQNLKALKAMLTAVLRKWPNVEFVTSEEMLDILKSTPREGQGASWA
ncbi:hypothetical protein [Rhodovulum adriaticum]|uniref:Polysaccharide deacetylase n=1 Tax=Rhodovulum adriaticum TaxID=35804 RepID=A0A4V2SKT2_RHOAD|nr:hypothetical protein [Rhodovulum adriaticum]MBK1636531.1 hypothetical protein [Rhodovulum adriaticum]TCP20756.1 hypothetical protein EV656_11729 [Rhodovulum adriaticum]